MFPSVRIPVFVVLALALAIGEAHATRTYKWVDEDGVTHYSQQPPPDGEAEIVEPSIGVPSNGGDGGADTVEAGEETGNGDEGPESMEAFCKQLQEQEQMLAGDQDVRVRQEDGSLEPLEGDDRAARRAEIQQQLDQHCD